jgi:P-type Cu+ transporter
VDRVLEYFVPGVVAAAALAFVIWTLGAWLVTGVPDVSRAVFAALVMGYPCALGMATPLAMIRGGGIAARQGILMCSGEAFQVFKDVPTVVLDKTGTITNGTPEVSEVVTIGSLDETEMLRLAGSVELVSEHPLGRAVVEHALIDGVELATADAFVAHPGRGVEAVVDGRHVLVGTARFLKEQGVDAGILRDRQAPLEERGQTVVAVAVDREAIGLLAIGDTVKDDAAGAVASMRDAGMELVMITDDNWRTARAVAADVGIERVLAEVLPEEKAAEVRTLQQAGERVAMVGDGINDAPALTQADVGIAMGTGTDIAIESADVVLVGDRLGGVVESYRIASRSYTKTVQNVALAFAFNGIGVPAAVTGLVHPVWAMIAMGTSVTVVLLNSFGDRMLTVPRLRRRAARSPVGRSDVPMRSEPSA